MNRTKSPKRRRAIARRRARYQAQKRWLAGVRASTKGKGFLVLKSDISPESLAEFRREWRKMLEADPYYGASYVGGD